MGGSRPEPPDWIREALRDAFRALTEGRPEDAGALCRRVLAAAPELAEAHFLVGMNWAIAGPRAARSPP
jgi:hypothetical protein